MSLYKSRAPNTERREDVVWIRQANMFIDDKFAQQMRADGEQKGVIEVGLTIT